ncbi:hypothetical protein H012_gp342 [Acanthamoeba polyphaga moumouvirus]|uniref:Uncharacterized protein n=1 Tax=Acanthamoeba polyphaga moumouvirus TaxID=1269028 RepID=L7RDH6_9VIRU|nr:hypothetical protein H012_gp342 [Acanthamoeba polyphaga moumouvirus]AGC02113.1 hypothetical protein Moumou_00587 [Acanthamoeba polyphaga moumouvirus]AQN68485.1 hypothetical protein [Saudi moumouvirus]
MQFNAKIVLHVSTKYPISIDQDGVLRYFNFPGGSYANAVVHGMPFDYSTIDKPMQGNKVIEKKSFQEQKFIFIHDYDDYNEEIYDSNDFIEPNEYYLEKIYLANFYHGKRNKH